MAQITSYVLLIFFWGCYFFLHSYLATNQIKQKLEKAGVGLKSQRLIYTGIAVLGLILIFIYSANFDSHHLFEQNKIIKTSSLFLTALGVIVMMKAFKNYPLKSFLGFEKEKDQLIVDEGILQYVRHPIYSATILIVLGYFLFDPRLSSLISAFCIFIYLIIGIYLEEKKLLLKYGEKYAKYKEEVPAIIPKWRSLF